MVNVTPMAFKSRGWSIFVGILAGGLSAHADEAPWPLGMLTPNGAVSGNVPVGYTVTGFTVASPGVERSINGYVALAPHRSAAPRGLVIFFTGGSGGSWWTGTNPESYQFAEDLRDEGFTIAQVKWSGTWFHSSPGDDAGSGRLGGRPATAIQFIYDNFYLPLGITDAKVDQNGGGFIITGNSGGSSQVSYALSHYGLDSILDAVIPTGGPPHANLAKAFLGEKTLPSGGKNYHFYNAGTRAWIDKGFGYFNKDGSGYLQDVSFSDRWIEESIATGGSDYYHPDTRVHFIIGDNDRGMQAQGSEYFNRLASEGTPLLSWELAPDTGHTIMQYAGGRAALWNAITAAPAFVPGDYNRSGMVDAADYTVWRDTFGQNITMGLGADGDSDGDVDGADFLVWQRNLGAKAPAPTAPTPIPEPAPVVLLAVALLTTMRRRRLPVKRAKNGLRSEQ